MAFEIPAFVGVGGEGNFDVEHVARAHEAAVFERTNSTEDERAGLVGAVGVGQEAGGLDHGFEHEDAREDGEGGEVVGEVFLGVGDGLDGDDAAGGLFEDAIDEIEAHGRVYEVGGCNDRTPGNRRAMPTITDQAICIRQWDWSETSQTVSLFARDLGIVRGVAKGAKRENARFSGGIEVATRGEVMVRPKAGEGLSLLIAWDLQEVYPGTRGTLEGFHATMLLMDVTQRALHEHDPHAAMFDALAGSLRALATDPVHLVVARYMWTVLEETGHRPELGRDVATGEPLARRGWYLFRPRLGGISDPESLREGVWEGEGEGGVAWKVRHETVELLRAIGEPAARSASVETLERGVRLLGAYVREVFRTELPTLEAYLRAAGTHSRVKGE